MEGGISTWHVGLSRGFFSATDALQRPLVVCDPVVDHFGQVDVTVLGLVGGAPGGETPRVADSSAVGKRSSVCKTLE